MCTVKVPGLIHILDRGDCLFRAAQRSLKSKVNYPPVSPQDISVVIQSVKLIFTI